MNNYRIHIGVHKTATTHLQDHLERLDETLRASDIKFVSRSQMRLTKIIRLLKNKNNPNFIIDFLEKTHWNLGLSTTFLKKKTIILSEENIIGNVDGILLSPIYPNLETRLLKLSQILKNDGFCLFLTIRNYGDILPSAYSEYLRHTNRFDGFDKIRDKFLKNPPNWLAFIERIKSILPKVELKVWTFENYIQSSPDFISEIIGLKIKDITLMPETKDTARLSTSTIKQIEAIDGSLSRWQKKTIKKRLIALNDYKEKFDPLTNSEKNYLSSLYNRDLSSIRESFPNILIE